MLQDLWAVKEEVPQLKLEKGGRVMHQPIWKESYKKLSVDEVGGDSDEGPPAACVCALAQTREA